MSVVTLVSGGLDSSLVSVLLKEADVEQWPLFIDYGQLAVEQEWRSAVQIHKRFGLPSPVRMNLSGFGELVPSGLTRRSLRVNEDAFLPGRNLLFLLAAASYAYSKDASALIIGLLDEKSRIFPDQSAAFLEQAERMIEVTLGRKLRIVAPLITFTKVDAVRLADSRGIENTYSCHSGGVTSCGVCVSCKELLDARIGSG